MEEKNAKENKLILLNYREFVKSNVLITAMFKASKFEKKLLAISFANMNRAYLDANNLICLELKASELREILKANKGSFYKCLEEAARSLTGKTLGYQNLKEKKFDYKVLIMESSYANGVLKMVYNPQFKDQLYNLSGNFTRLNLEYYLSFSSSYSLDLYELLKSYAFVKKGNTDSGIYIVTIPLSELKLLLGITDSNEENVKKVLKDKEKPDFDKAVNAEKKPKFVDWSLFKKKVLTVGIKEINEKTNMEISFKAKRGGANGAPVYAVEFIITNKDIRKQQETENLKKREQQECLEKLRSMEILYSLTEVELDSIAKAAGYDLDKINKAVECSKGQQIDNLAGWLVAAIKNGYQTQARKNSFNQFPQQNYNWETLEKELLSN